LRAEQPEYADEHAPVYSPDKRLFKEGREPRALGCPSFHELQFLPDSWQLARYSGDGSGPIADHVWSLEEVIA
jgi:hypothetical protein